MTTGSDWRAQVGRTWAENYRLTDRSFAGLTERLLARIGGCEGQNVLDIGCGAGELSLAVARGKSGIAVSSMSRHLSPITLACLPKDRDGVF